MSTRCAWENDMQHSKTKHSWSRVDCLKMPTKAVGHEE